MEAEPLPVEHGNEPALGFRFGGVAYMPDVSLIPPRSLERLYGLDLLIIDALRDTPHDPFLRHRRVGPHRAGEAGRAVLTNLHTDLDYAPPRRAPAGESVVPAYDGLVLTLPA